MEIPRKKKNEKRKTKEDLINKALEIALDTRKFEIELYWKRTGIFCSLYWCYFVGYYNVFSNSKSHWASLFIAALGFYYLFYGIWQNRGVSFGKRIGRLILRN